MEQNRESKVAFYGSRVAVVAATIGLYHIDWVNTFSGNVGRDVMVQTYGDLANHVGDIIHGMGAMTLGFYTGIVLEKLGVEPKVARISGMFVMAGLFAFVHWAELASFMNHSDILDVPAIWLGFLGSACYHEIYSKKARTFMEPIKQ